MPDLDEVDLLKLQMQVHSIEGDLRAFVYDDLPRLIAESRRLSWLLQHALGDIEVEINGVVRSVRTRDDIDQAMKDAEEKPRA
jgi:hypothetical protein